MSNDGHYHMRARTPEEIADEKKRHDKKVFADLQRKDDLKWLLADKRGRRFVYGLLESTGLMGSTLVNGAPSPVLEGRRSVGREIVGEIITDHPHAYLAMVTDTLNDASKA